MNEPQDTRSGWQQTIICYALLAVLTVISFSLLPGLVQSLSHLGFVLGFNHYAMTVLNQWSFVVLGILWLIAFFSVEHYLRAGIKHGSLWQRVGKVFGWEVALIALIYAIQLIPVT